MSESMKKYIQKVTNESYEMGYKHAQEKLIKILILEGYLKHQDERKLLRLAKDEREDYLERVGE